MEKTLILIHGSKEHYKRYQDFITFLQKNNINVVSDNLITHGIAELENHNFTLDQTIQSAMDIIERAKKNYPNSKFYLLGHSFGSFVVKYITYKNMENFDGIILSGTNDPSKFLLKTGKMVTSIGNQNKVSKFAEFASYGMLEFKSRLKNKDKFWGSNDQKVIQEFLDSPLTGKPFTKKSLNAMFTMILECNDLRTLKNFENKNLPQLIIYGKQDPVPNFGKDIKKMVKKQTKAGLVTPQVIEYQNSRHEVLFDLEKDKAYQDVLNFIEQN